MSIQPHPHFVNLIVYSVGGRSTIAGTRLTLSIVHSH